MTSSDLRAHFENAFGGICSAIETKHGENLMEISVSAEAFEKLVQHWAGSSPSARPRLRGLTLARPRGKVFQLVFELGSNAPFVLLSVDWTKPSPFPNLSKIWPYSAWWTNELRSFEGSSIDVLHKEGGVQWRQS